MPADLLFDAFFLLKKLDLLQLSFAFEIKVFQQVQQDVLLRTLKSHYITIGPNGEKNLNLIFGGSRVLFIPLTQPDPSQLNSIFKIQCDCKVKDCHHAPAATFLLWHAVRQSPIPSNYPGETKHKMESLKRRLQQLVGGEPEPLRPVSLPDEAPLKQETPVMDKKQKDNVFKGIVLMLSLPQNFPMPDKKPDFSLPPTRAQEGVVGYSLPYKIYYRGLSLVSSKEIESSALLSSIPKPLLPIRSSHWLESKSYQLSEINQLRDPDYYPYFLDDEEKGLLDILKSWAEGLSTESPLWLGLASPSGQQFFSVKQLRFVPKNSSEHFVWTLKDSPEKKSFFLDYSFEGDHSTILFFPNFYYDWAKEVLVFHAGASETAHLWKILHLLTYPSQTISFTHPFLVVDQIRKTPLNHSEHLGLLEDNFLSAQPGYPERASREVTAIHPRINLSSTARGISFSFTDKETGLTLGNLPYLFTKLAAGMKKGIASFLNIDPVKTAFRRRGMRRERDLRFMKHAGVFAFLVHEALDQVLHPERQMAQIEFYKQLDQKLAHILLQSEKIPMTVKSLKELCSGPVIQLAEHFIEKLIAIMGETVILLSGEEKTLWPLHRWVGFIFQHLIDDAVKKTKGEALLKTRTSPLFLPDEETFYPPLSFLSEGEKSHEYPFFQDQKLVEQIALWMPLRDLGFEVTIDGHSIELMNEGDFEARFELLEGAANNTSTNPVGTNPDAVKNPETPGVADRGGLIDWFELHPQFFFKGIPLEGAKAHSLSQDGYLMFEGKMYLLPQKGIPSLKSLERFWAKIAGSQSDKKYRSIGHSFYQLPRHQTLELLAIRASGVDIQGNESWKNICAFYDNLGNHPGEIELPPHLVKVLKPYQKQGVRWIHDLYHLRMGCILADDMGLGKTLQTLTFLEILRQQGTLSKTLIIVPTSLTYNWYTEGNKFTPDLPLHVFQSKEREQYFNFLKENEHGGVVVTYGLFVEHAALFAQENWNIHVYDEAQNLKTIHTQRTNTARQIPAQFKLCLTGTPLENHLGEFFSLMDLVVPGALGSLEEFRKNYVRPEKPDPEAVDFLKLKIRPLLLRRTKGEILKELPAKIESTIKLPMDDKQKKIYRDIALAWNQKVQESIESLGEAKSQIVMLTALLRLRQVCSDPAGVPGIKYTPLPPKVALLMETLEEILQEGHSLIIFTQFLHTFERIKKELSEKQLPFFSIQGSTSKKMREKELKGFDECSTGAIMFMTLKTGGVGLNLTKASFVFHIEPWWNPAVENQATDRAHRIGQNRNVQVYRYIMQDSVEEKITLLKQRKALRFDLLFSEVEKDAPTSGTHSHLTREDFIHLIQG